MASTTIKSSNKSSGTCALCSEKHNRTRPSFCQCEHCSIPLCFDCMKEHHDELLQDVAQTSHQYNELQQLVQSKQTMINEETAKSIDDANRYFETYIGELRATQNKIIVDMEKAKQNAEDHVRKIDADLRLIGGEIQGLAKESVVQTAKMKIVSEELKEIEQQLSPYQIIRTENLINTQPDLSMRFGCPSVEIKTDHSTEMEVNETCQTDPHKSAFKSSFSGLSWESPVVQKFPVIQTPANKDGNVAKNNSTDSDEDDNDNNDSDFDSNASHIDTSDDVDRMASDGKNILYTTYYDDEPDRLAYCCMDDDNDDEDEYQPWNRSRIVNMIWWNTIGKFVCATKNGLSTVDYARKKFRILDVKRGKWSFVRVAANSIHLFVWIKSKENDVHGIKVYSGQFEWIRNIDFDRSPKELFLNESVSFCATDNLIASIYSHMQNNRKVLEVIFYDMNMNKINSITLDECKRKTEIRTDGKHRFFITTGLRSFHIVSSKQLNETINLQRNGKWIAVLDDQHVAVSNGRCDVQIVRYSPNDRSALLESN